MESADLLAIHDLLARYGHVVDDGDWQRLSDVFCDDGEFDLQAIGRGTAHGMDELRVCFAHLEHPLAHLTTNVMIEPDGAQRARVRCKYLVVSDDGRVRTGEYHDDVVHTTSGWRIERRTVVPRRARPGRA
ncbi:MAG TPA: nuclear transport factor 2 family protein [Acidimicrobiales bacterium]